MDGPLGELWSFFNGEPKSISFWPSINAILKRNYCILWIRDCQKLPKSVIPASVRNVMNIPIAMKQRATFYYVTNLNQDQTV